MQSKKFRPYKFYIGDLVSPTYSSDINYGIIIKIRFDILIPYAEVYWQDGKIKKESEMDIEVVSQI